MHEHNPGVVVQACNPSAQGSGSRTVREFRVILSYTVKFMTSLGYIRSCLTKEGRKKGGRKRGRD